MKLETHLLDFHCHLDLYPNYVDLFKECEKLKIYTLAVTTTPKTWRRNCEITRSNKYVRCSLGFHPQLVNENSKSDLELWKKYLPEARYIGEVGLDSSTKFSRTINEQIDVFEQILSSCSKAGGKILSVHSLRAVDKVLDLIESTLPANRGKVVLHWFTGNEREAERAVQLGCYFSVNSQMLQTKRSLNLMSVIPADKILTETDGPFAKERGKSLEPKDVSLAIKYLAKLTQKTQPYTAQKVISNFKALTSLT